MRAGRLTGSSWGPDAGQGPRVGRRWPVIGGMVRHPEDGDRPVRSRIGKRLHGGNAVDIEAEVKRRVGPGIHPGLANRVAARSSRFSFNAQWGHRALCRPHCRTDAPELVQSDEEPVRRGQILFVSR